MSSLQRLCLRVTLAGCLILNGFAIWHLSSSCGDVHADTTVLLNGGPFVSSQPQIVVASQLDEVRILFKNAERLVFASGISTLQTTPVAISTQPQPMGRLALRTGFDSTIVFRQDGTPTGDDIMFALANESGISAPLVLTADLAEDAHPDCCFTATGLNEFVWESRPAVGSPQVFVFRDTLFPVYVADGEDPAVGAGAGGVTLVAYVRAGVVHGRRHSGNSVLSVEETVASLPGGASDVRVEGDLTGSFHVLFVSSGHLYHCEDSGGGFGPPALLSAVDGAGSLFVASDGAIVAGYTLAGVTYAIEKQPGTPFSTPVALSPVGVLTEQGSVARDSLGHYHAAWVAGGDVYYHNNVPVPVADFSADMQAGEQALVVTFTSQSQGVITDYLWDFGDGATSDLPSPTHTYQQAGDHTVSLTVSGPGGTDTVAKPDYIQVAVSAHILRVPDLSVVAGKHVSSPVLATHAAPMEGFTVALVYDDTWLSNVDVTLSGSLSAPFVPDLFLVSNTPAGALSTLVHTVLMEVSAPIEGLAIPAGLNQRISSIEYTVDPLTPTGTEIPFTLTDGLLMPPMSNTFAQGGQSVAPFLDSGRTTVVALPQNRFVRGDATGDDSLDIADAVAILSTLFAAQPFPGCPDAADANDSGSINIADAVAVLTFLFGGGPQLMYPSPDCGLDPTADTLSCTQSSCP